MTKSKTKLGLLAIALVGVLSMGAASANTTPTAKADLDSVVLTSDNTISLNDEVNGDTVAKVIQKARDLDSKFGLKDVVGFPKRPIYLFLNTPGGSIQDGLELIDQLKSMKRPVYTITLFAASMGFQICQNLGTRYIVQNGVLMSHRARGGFQGEFGGTSPSQIDSRYSFWLSRLNEMDAQTVKRTEGKQTLESYQKSYASEMWRTGSQSVKEGYADKVVGVNCDASLNGVTEHEVQFMGMAITYDLSNCPMITAPQNIKASIRTNKGFYPIKSFLEAMGGFGYSCIQATATNPNQVCAIDPSITLEKVYNVNSDFKSNYEAKQRQVIYMTIGN